MHVSSHPSRSRLSPTLALLGLALLLALATPRAARGEVSNPFSGVNPAQAEAEEAAAARKAAQKSSEAPSASSSSNSTLLIIAVVVAGILIAGIGYMIFRDSRRLAPVAEGGSGSRGTVPSIATRRQKRRAQAKHARRQRKRNR
jgi:hypothetical protein